MYRLWNNCIFNGILSFGMNNNFEKIQQQLTFHDVDNATDIAFFDNETFGRILNRIHAIDNLTDLVHIQIFHEIIVQNGRFDELTRSKTNKQTKYLVNRIEKTFQQKIQKYYASPWS